MKRILHYLAAVLLIVIASCQKAPELTLSGLTTLEVSADGGSGTISFTTNRDWSASWSASWVSVSPSSGSASDGPVTVTVRCEPNTTYDPRSATVTITAEGLTQTVTVSQASRLVPTAVDLGLRVKWASFNLGASKPEEYGDYYAWGETETKSDYSWETYKWANGSETKLTKYCNATSYWAGSGSPDNKLQLDPEDDVAHVKLGGKWRMPTDFDWTELREKCTWAWTTSNGINGTKVTGPSGNSIFLPAAGYRPGTSLNDAGSNGYYWSSSLLESNSCNAKNVRFDFKVVGRSNYSRFLGLSVRPVTE